MMQEKVDEMLDMLNDAGEIVGVASRNDVMQSDVRNYRLVSAFLRSPDGQFHILRRAYTKKNFGGCFASVGGCVQAGESYEQALFREIEEEVFLKPIDYTWQLLGYTNPKIDDTYGHVAVYELICSKEVTYNPEDFCEIRTLSLDELHQLCQQQTDVSHNLPIYIKKFYASF